MVGEHYEPAAADVVDGDVLGHADVVGWFVVVIGWVWWHGHGPDLNSGQLDPAEVSSYRPGPACEVGKGRLTYYRRGVGNLVLLCAGHHRAQHDGEFRIQRLGRGRFRFRRADGRLLPDHVDPAQFSDTPTPVEDDYADIPADAATTRWIGDRLDRHYAISVLAQHRKQPAHRAS